MSLSSETVIGGVGVCCLDHVILAPRAEAGGGARVAEYLAQGGGLTATALVAARRLGARAWFQGVVGTDEVGRKIVDELEREGVDCTSVLSVAGSVSPISFVFVEPGTGERTIYHRPAGPWSLPARPKGSLPESDVLLIDGHLREWMLSAMADARQRGIPIVADLVPPVGEGDLLAQVDVLIAPERSIEKLECGKDAQAAVEKILAAGPRVAVITMGERGWIAGADLWRGEAFEVEVVDTTGAGDVFHGAFGVAMARGWDVPRCAEFASAVAALKCRKLGGSTGIPSLSETLAFLGEMRPEGWGRGRNSDEFRSGDRSTRASG